MTSHLLALKTKTGAAAQLAAAKKASEEQKSKSSSSDARFWSPVFDKEKQTGSAVVRFLPSPEQDHIDWTKLFRRSFKGPTGKWYIENCLTTIGKEDPVGEVCSRLWNSGIESDKKVASEMKRKITYIANILVVTDPANRENEGKVFLWKFGSQIFEIVEDAMNPKDPTDDQILAFNPFMGANFKIKMIPKEVNGKTVQSYERSVFAAPSAIADDDDEVIAICGKAHKLSEFDAVGNFKSYEELKRQLFTVVGPTCGSGIQTVIGWEAEKAGSSQPPKETKAAATTTKSDAPPFDLDDDIPDDVMTTKTTVKVADTEAVDDELMRVLLG